MTGLRPEGCGGGFGHALSGVRVQRVQKVQKVQRVVVSPCRAMNFIAACRRQALRDFPPDTVILSEAKNLGTWCI